jgi:hypothetical protein
MVVRLAAERVDAALQIAPYDADASGLLRPPHVGQLRGGDGRLTSARIASS